MSESLQPHAHEPWTVAQQSSLSMEFSRQEYWRGLPFPSPGDLPNPEMEVVPIASQVDFLLSEPPGQPFDEADQFRMPVLPLPCV